MSLVLRLKDFESLKIGENTTIQVVKEKGKVKCIIDAPLEIQIEILRLDENQIEMMGNK